MAGELSAFPSPSSIRRLFLPKEAVRDVLGFGLDVIGGHEVPAAQVHEFIKVSALWDGRTF